MAKDCYIFGAGEASYPQCVPPRGEVTVIAADGGFPAAVRVFGSPDLVVGDFDSLGYLPTCVPTVCHPPEKDETDLLLAVREGMARGARRFWIYGALGGRLDHTVANLQVLAYLAAAGAEGYLFGADGTAVTAIAGGQSLLFPVGYRGTLSVLALGGPAEGVTLRGVKYPLEAAAMSSAFPLGVSNELLGEGAAVVLGAGSLHVFFTYDPSRPLPSRNGGYAENK